MQVCQSPDHKCVSTIAHVTARYIIMAPFQCINDLPMQVTGHARVPINSSELLHGGRVRVTALKPYGSHLAHAKNCGL